MTEDETQELEISDKGLLMKDGAPLVAMSEKEYQQMRQDFMALYKAFQDYFNASTAKTHPRIPYEALLIAKKSLLFKEE